MNDYILKMRGLANLLGVAGQILSNDKLIFYILGGLGPNHDSLVINLTYRHDSISLQDMLFFISKSRY